MFVSGRSAVKDNILVIGTIRPIFPVSVRKLVRLQILAFTAFCFGCTQPDLNLPPVSQTGDVTLTATVGLKGKGQFPTGSQVILSLNRISSSADPATALAGDVLHLSQPDRNIRVTIPLDKSKIAVCKSKKTCAITVRVIQNGKLLYKNKRPTPYHLGQESVGIWVNAVS